MATINLTNVKKIYDNGYIYEKVEPQAFCEKCNKNLCKIHYHNEVSCPFSKDN